MDKCVWSAVSSRVNSKLPRKWRQAEQAPDVRLVDPDASDEEEEDEEEQDEEDEEEGE